MRITARYAKINSTDTESMERDIKSKFTLLERELAINFDKHRATCMTH